MDTIAPVSCSIVHVYSFMFMCVLCVPDLYSFL
jgi:hypothetical protein